MQESPGEATILLNDLKLGNKEALSKLIPLVYAELRALASRFLKAERAGHTLQPTALVHEAYLRLVQQDHADWKNRAHFLAVAAQLMRRILVDYARARGTAKRGGAALCIESRVVELRYFAGLTVEETAEVLAISPRTVERDWAMAAAWLRTELSKGRSI